VPVPTIMIKIPVAAEELWISAVNAIPQTTKSNGKSIVSKSFKNIAVSSGYLSGSNPMLMTSKPTKIKPNPHKIVPICLTLSFLIKHIITPTNAIAAMTIFTIFNDENATMLSQQHPEWKTGNPTYFTEDRALFRIEQIYGIKQIREMESDFGMLPAPKYDEAQEQYSSYVHPGQSNSICIPVTNTRLELTGALLEDGSYKSFEKIRPAFYDVTLKGRIARDEDTTEMLDIIFATLNPDLALALTKSAGITIDTDMRKIYTNDMDAYTSMLTVSAKLNERLLKLCVDKILALGN